ncbi:MAG: hypothetical protein EHM93_05655 [Bacteroidales bacterium]|nr:MAG: hypothetical protein EHM93_05655 [Bacteroidales bacterium]
MKKQILIGLILGSSILTVNAQTWSGSTPGNIYYNQGYVGLGATPQNPLHIEYNLNNGSLLYGINTQSMGTDAKSYSPNLFLIHTRLDACLGLHAYVYRKSASTSWTGGTVRLSSAADGSWYSQDNRYNNLNWIDFIGNGEGIDLGSIDNNPAISIRGTQVGIGTTTPTLAKLQIVGNIWAGNESPNYTVHSSSKIEVFGTSQTETSIGFWQQGIASSLIGSKPGDMNFYLTNTYDGSNLGIASKSITLNPNGLVGIGTTSPTYKLDVCGTIRAKEVIVDLNGTCAPDFVFKSNYKLMDLKELENFVKTNQHLPEIASEKEMVENGVNMKDLQMKFLQKMEEMTLYIIEQNKKNELQSKEIELLKQEIELLKTK